jgi:hypothetical protein
MGVDNMNLAANSSVLASKSLETNIQITGEKMLKIANKV